MNNRQWASRWAVFPVGGRGLLTNLGHEKPFGASQHVAVVNDGRRTALYVEGCPVVGSPTTRSTGVATRGLLWLISR